MLDKWKPVKSSYGELYMRKFGFGAGRGVTTAAVDSAVQGRGSRRPCLKYFCSA